MCYNTSTDLALTEVGKIQSSWQEQITFLLLLKVFFFNGFPKVLRAKISNFQSVVFQNASEIISQKFWRSTEVGFHILLVATVVHV